MKKLRLLLSIFALSSLTGCSLIDDLYKTPQQEEESQKEEPKPEEPAEKEEDVKKVGEFYGRVVNDKKHIGYDFSKSLDAIEKPSTGVGEINIYSFNDFHGSVVQTSNEVGLKRLGSFYKEKSRLDNTLIFDQGDTYQGSFESNYNHGALVQDVFNYAGVSVRTVGNHDFDWGLQALKDVVNRKIGDDYIPCLAANVYDYSNGATGTAQQKDYGKEYSTFTLDNGIKVGVVGVIGDNQITSICSQLVENICFTNHVQKIKEISDYLRTTKDCDIVIASTHESSQDMYETGSSVADISPVTNKRYVDLVLGGHSHYDISNEANGVKFVQWSSNGESSGSIKLKYDFSSSEVLYEQTEVDTLTYNEMVEATSQIDPTINAIVDNYLTEVEDIANEVLSTNFSGYFDTNSIARVMSEAIYNRVSLTVSNLDFAVVNYARTYFKGSTFTYRDLYKCFPFDNQIILLDIKSSYAINGLSYNFTYKGDESLNPQYGHTYKCAVLDYVALHQNENREYDKFPDASKGYSVFNDTTGNAPTYRDILYDYLKANPTKTFSSSNYQSDNPHFVN